MIICSKYIDKLDKLADWQTSLGGGGTGGGRGEAQNRRIV